MAIELSTIMQFLAAIFTLIAAYFSFVIYRYNRQSKSWLAITLALSILFVRRVIGFYIIAYDTGYIEDITNFLDRPLIPLIVSILFLLGLYGMKKNFESFEVLKDKVQAKLKVFKRRVKKKP
jgi:hypothetical protein